MILPPLYPLVSLELSTPPPLPCESTLPARRELPVTLSASLPKPPLAAVAVTSGDPALLPPPPRCLLRGLPVEDDPVAMGGAAAGMDSRSSLPIRFGLPVNDSRSSSEESSSNGDREPPAAGETPPIGFVLLAGLTPAAAPLTG